MMCIFACPVSATGAADLAGPVLAAGNSADMLAAAANAAANAGGLAAVANAAAGAGGVDVTVEEAFSFAQHMSEEGRKLLAKAQNSPKGSISPEALKTLSQMLGRTKLLNHM